MTLRIGFIGAGIGASHIAACKSLPGMWDVVALCDLDAGRRAVVAAEHGVPVETDRMEDLFSMGLDVISVCTPSGLHFRQAAQVLASGCHAVIEKPVAGSLAEVDKLAEMERASGKRACPIFQYRFGHGIGRLHHLIGKGMAGRPNMATAETHWWRAEEYYNRAAWRGTWDGEMGGTFATHAIHIHDLLCEVLGEVEEVHARTARWLRGNQTEDIGTLSLRFANGALATSSVSCGSRQQTSRLRFLFDDLVAESGLDPYNPGHMPWTFPDDRPGRAAEIEAALADYDPLPERFPGYFHRLHTALTTGAEPPVSLADGRRSIELLTAAYWSAHTGAAVKLPIAPDHPFYAGWITAMKESMHG